jgi:hypothetical protein
MSPADRSDRDEALNERNYGLLFPSLDAAIANGLDSTLRDALAAYPRPGAVDATQMHA